jgi:hypothetical protein
VRFLEHAGYDLGSSRDSAMLCLIVQARKMVFCRVPALSLFFVETHASCHHFAVLIDSVHAK